jgi:isoleucyl-tRNA synthetase
VNIFSEETIMFSAVDTKTPLAQQEQKIAEFWVKNDILGKSIRESLNCPSFPFYDGPPFATGLPHYGHLVVGTIKDLVLRFKAMHGYRVSRRFGWDCHGLPVENEIEKAKNLTGASSIEAFGIDKFNEECRSIVLRYTKEWETTVARFGRWVDFSDTYRTMDPTFMESVWWVFAELWRKGLIYEGYKVMPYSAKLGTPLSNFEASENYKEVDDPAVVVALELENDPKTALLIWTTTPWTLPSNLAVMVHPEVDYTVFEHVETGKRYIVAQSRAAAVLKDLESYTAIKTMRGQELAGTTYRPLFPFFLSYKERGAFRVILDDFVQLDEGTGLVHSAPGFGEVDFYACQRAGIPVVCPVDQNGHFTDEVPPYQGRFVKECDKDIIRELKKEGKILVHETIRHRYPFCWRSDTPLIYKAVSTWFVAVEKIKDRLLRANEAITWVPDHLKHGRFGRWLENARDWAISRNRYWGTPIPLWRADDGEIIVVESRQQLRELTGADPSDLHRHFIDGLTITKNGKEYRRIPEVFDCWFESGSMPYAQIHYPFENKKLFAQEFPAEFIAEALDQTRGWFYTLTVLGAALFDSPAFKNVVVNGIVLAEDGAKMSKRLRNYPDPLEVVGKYGADSVRLYMLNSPVVHADDLCFSEAGVELTLRQVLLPLWNAVSFFVTYARIYRWEPPAAYSAPEEELDRWILSVTTKLVCDVEAALDRYDISKASALLQPFVDHLTNWYIRRSRRRFWSDSDSPDRQQAFETLYQVLMTFSKVMAPFVPFTAELVWQTLRTSHDAESVHLSRYPAIDIFPRDHRLEAAHEAAQTVVTLAHALRKTLKLKVRQPLPRAFIVTTDAAVRDLLSSVQGIIADEINVKRIELSDDEHIFVSLKAKPNFRVLGKRVGHRMPAVQHALEHLHYSKLRELLDRGVVALHLDDSTRLEVTKDEVDVVRVVRDSVVAMHEEGMTVALDVALDEALLAEGLVREVVNKLNTMRRDHDLAVTDRITVVIQTTPAAQAAIEAHLAYVMDETLATSIQFGQTAGTTWDLNGEPTVIAIVKAL